MKKKYTRLRCCTNCILDRFMDSLSVIEVPCSLLEIGFGANKHTGRTIMEKAPKVTWFGIDPKWDDHADRGIAHGTAGKMPYEDNSFEWVIAINSMEHWGNYDKYEDCMSEIHRILAPGATFYAITPMNSHACKPFVNNDINGVSNMLSGYSSVYMKRWGEDNKEYMLETWAVK